MAYILQDNFIFFILSTALALLENIFHKNNSADNHCILQMEVHVPK